MTLVEVQVKWSVILMDRFGPDNFSTLQIKGHVLHRARAHLKVPAWLLVWNALLTRKLPMFLSRRLNEISGGCEKILPVSGSFWSNLKFFRMMDLTAWLWGWNVRVNGIDHFTVVGLVTRPLNGSEAGVDFVLIQTSLLLLCKSSCSYAN